MKIPRKLYFKTKLTKLDPLTLQKSSGTFSRGKIVGFSQKIKINGKLYLRTSRDAKIGETNVIPYSKLGSVNIDYRPMKIPRKLKFKEGVRKVNPLTMSNIGKTFKKGLVVDFSQKVKLHGKLYLRTSHDKSLNKNKVIAYSDLINL